MQESSTNFNSGNMQNALHIKAAILPGHRIELAVPDIDEGTAVDVFVVVSEDTRPRKSALEIIRGLKGHRLFHSPEEVDRYLKQERDAWGS